MSVAPSTPPDAELSRPSTSATRRTNVAGRLLSRHADALDVLQDVFVEALAELGSLRDPEALRPWLLRRTVRGVFRARRGRHLAGLDERLPSRRGLRVLMTHGRSDEILPVEPDAMLAGRMRDAGIDVDFFQFDGGHEVTSDVGDRVTAFLRDIAPD